MAPSKTVLLPLLAAVPYASAWGALGHTTVAFIAQNYVSSKTARFAQQVLGDKSGEYLANIAIWADSYRYEAGGEFSQHYHYIDALDVVPSNCNVVYERDCPEDGCIVSAIANYSTRVVQKSVGIEEQQKAIKWLVHFVGDIHQPLHTENLAIGGNQINVTFDGVATNLHYAWDTSIPQKAFGNFTIENSRTWASALTREIKFGKYKKESRAWLKGSNVKKPVDSAMYWASDTNKLVCSAVLPQGPDPVFGKELAGRYFEDAVPVVQRQIAKAGYRLAAWLDAVVESAERGHGHGKGDKDHDRDHKRSEFEFEPWMEKAKQARRDFGSGCGCTAEEHGH